MKKQLARYIHPISLDWCGIEPPSSNRTDVVLGLYYNVLCPQERDAESRKKFYSWISAMNPYAPFPLNREDLFLCSPSTCKGIVNKSGYGNCGEMGALGLMYLSEAGWQGRAGTFQIRRPEKAPLPNGLTNAKSRTHTFLIIGLGVNSKTEGNEFQSLGFNPVVCDPYSREKSYPVTDMYGRLHNYYGLSPKTATPLLAKVDPHIDTIHLFCSNIFSANEFIEPFLSLKNPIPEATAIARLLHSFNVSILRENKISLMKEITNQISSLLFELNRMETTLKLDLKAKTLLDGHKKENAAEEQILSLVREIRESTTLLRDLKNVHTCQHHVFTLCSQSERFVDPNSCLFL